MSLLELLFAFLASLSMSANVMAAILVSSSLHKSQSVEWEFGLEILACGLLSLVPLPRRSIVLSPQNRFACKSGVLIQ